MSIQGKEHIPKKGTFGQIQDTLQLLLVGQVQLNNRFDELETRFDRLEIKVDNLQIDFRQFKKDVSVHFEQQTEIMLEIRDSHHRRISCLEQKFA